MAFGVPTAFTRNRDEGMQGTAREGRRAMGERDTAAMLESIAITLICAILALLAYCLETL